MTKGSIWTIGHSTRTKEEFMELLNKNMISHLIDVRSFPGSRAYPHFNQESMRDWLACSGFDYSHMPALGGMRKLKPSAENGAWRNKSFHSYATYMQTDEFKEGLNELFYQASQTRTVIMCAEAVPWRCHRGLISDACVAKGWNVYEIIGTGEPKRHALKSFAKIDDSGNVTYPIAEPACSCADAVSLFSV